MFDDDDQVEIKPKRSRRAVHAFLETIASMNAELNADREVTRIPGALNDVLGSVMRLAHHDHLVIVLSDFDGIDDSTHRRLSGIAAHNDLVLMLVYDPAAVEARSRGRAVVGDHAMQAELDLGSKETVAALKGYSDERLQRILNWQMEINLSVLPISAGEETLPQIRRLLGKYVSGGGR